MFGIGQQEMIVFLIIVLIIFGPTQLPKLARTMGGAIRDFKSGLQGAEKDLQDAADEASAPLETKAEIENKKDAQSYNRTPEEARQKDA